MLFAGGLGGADKKTSEPEAPSDLFGLHIGVIAAYNVLIGYITAHNISEAGLCKFF